MSYAKWRIFKVFQLCCSYEVAPEQKARVTYDNILRLVDDPDIIEPIKFLREREIVHYQRFGDTLPQSCKLYIFFWSKVLPLLHF